MRRKTALGIVKSLFTDSSDEFDESLPSGYPEIYIDSSDDTLAVDYSVRIQGVDANPRGIDNNLNTEWGKRLSRYLNTSGMGTDINVTVNDRGVRLHTNKQAPINSLYDLVLTHPLIIRREIESTTDPGSRENPLRYRCKQPNWVVGGSTAMEKKVYHTQSDEETRAAHPIPERYHEFLTELDTDTIPIERYLHGQQDLKLDVRKPDTGYVVQQGLPTGTWCNSDRRKPVSLAFIIRCCPWDITEWSSWIDATNYIQIQYGKDGRIHLSEEDQEKYIIQSKVTDDQRTTDPQVAGDIVSTIVEELTDDAYSNALIEYASGNIITTDEVPHSVMGIGYPTDAFISQYSGFSPGKSPVSDVHGIGEKTVGRIAEQINRYDTLAETDPNDLSVSNAYFDNDPAKVIDIAKLSCRIATELISHDKIPELPDYVSETPVTYDFSQ